MSRSISMTTWNIEFYTFSLQIFNLHTFHVNVNSAEPTLSVLNNKMIASIRVHLMKFNNARFRSGSHSLSSIAPSCAKSGNRPEHSIDIFKCNIIA